MAATVKRFDASRDDGEWAAVPLGDDSPASPIAPSSPAHDATFEHAVAAAQAASDRGDFAAAAAVLEQFLETEPDHLDAIERLIEISTAGGLASNLEAAEVRLCDVCLIAGRYAEAQVVAQDLALRYPGNTDHRARAERIALLAKQSGAESIAPLSSAIDRSPPPSRPLSAPPPSRPPSASPPRLPPSAPTPTRTPTPTATRMPTPTTRTRTEPARPAPPPRTEEDIVLDRALGEIRAALRERAFVATPARLEELDRLVDAGRFDEAATPLEIIACVPDLRMAAGTRLARVYRERGQPAAALVCLEWVAELPPATAEAGHQLAYELALTLEALGQHAEALGVYGELVADAGPGYRDVVARMTQLRG
jgi:tetratricopeptide (TPR) repeat protein